MRFDRDSTPSGHIVVSFQPYFCSPISPPSLFRIYPALCFVSRLVTLQASRLAGPCGQSHESARILNAQSLGSCSFLSIWYNANPPTRAYVLFLHVVPRFARKKCGMATFAPSTRSVSDLLDVPLRGLQVSPGTVHGYTWNIEHGPGQPTLQGLLYSACMSKSTKAR